MSAAPAEMIRSGLRFMAATMLGTVWCAFAAVTVLRLTSSASAQFVTAAASVLVPGSSPETNSTTR